MKLTKIGEFLNRSKISIDIQDDLQYNRVTIRINHNGVSLRDSEIGKKIGTKKQFILKAGQFIVSKIDARYGAFGIAPDEVEGAIITGNFWAYDVDKKKVNIEWFNQFTNSPDFYNICERASSGITHRKYLDEKFFLNYEILLPSVDEQLIQIEKINTQKISFGNLTTELTHQLTLVKKLRQQLLQDAVQGKLVPQNATDEPAGELLKKIKAEKALRQAQGKLKKEKELPPIKPEEIPFEIPENWVWCRLGEACLINPRNKADDNIDAAFVPMPMISRKYNEPPQFEIRKWSEIKSGFTHFSNDDVVVAKITPCFENSKAGIMKNLPNGIGAGTTELHVIRGNSFVLSEFIYAFIKTPEFLANGERIMRGVAGQQRVPSEYFYETLIPLPPITEQNRIVQKLDELMQYCNDLEASIKESEIQNEKLLQQVLREALRKEPVNS
jgi:type I restriction enzyme S subunit